MTTQEKRKGKWLLRMSSGCTELLYGKAADFFAFFAKALSQSNAPDSKISKKNNILHRDLSYYSVYIIRGGQTLKIALQ